MLRLRICPHCQEEIRSPEVYFCHRCGAELPLPLGAKETSRSVETGHTPSSPKRKPKNRRWVVAAAALCVALVPAIGAGVYYFQTRTSTLPAGRQASLPSSPRNEVFVTDFSFEVENHPFSAKGLSEIVPAEIDLYLESINPEILLPSLVSTKDWAKAESFFSEKFGLNAGEATSFLEDEFAVVQESTASAFLARVKDTNFVEQKIEEVRSFEGWQAKMVNGFLVVSNSFDLTHAIEEAQKKLTLNLSLTSSFVEARKKLPQTGQIFVYGEKRPEFIPDEVKGEAFVVSKKEDGTLITGL